MPEAPSRRSAPAFVASCAFGALGAVFLLIGFFSGNEPLVLVATALGSVSLVAALVWRGQLISKWHADRYRKSRPRASVPPRSGRVRPPAPPR